MNDPNPFAPPRADFFAPKSVDGSANCWRRGRHAVVEVDLPVLERRCVKCNVPTGQGYQAKLSWHTPWIYALLLLNILVYAVAALVVRKRVDLFVPLCANHMARRKTYAILKYASLALFIIAFAVGISQTGSESALIALAVMAPVSIVAAVVFSTLGQSVRASKITDGHVLLAGVCGDYRDQLQPFARTL